MSTIMDGEAVNNYDALSRLEYSSGLVLTIWRARSGWNASGSSWATPAEPVLDLLNQEYKDAGWILDTAMERPKVLKNPARRIRKVSCLSKQDLRSVCGK